MSKQVVDLKEQDIENLKVLKTRSKFLIEELGQISLLEIVLKERKEQAKEFRLKTKEMEIELAEYLEKQYGKGNVDLETGKFTPVSG
jgi:hypothetical protein